jgi:hypothetical protein
MAWERVDGVCLVKRDVEVARWSNPRTVGKLRKVMACCKMVDLGVISPGVKGVGGQELEEVSWREVLFHSHLVMGGKDSEI